MTNMFAAIAFLVAGMAMMVLMQTDLNFLGFTMATCIVSFVIGLVLFTAALYGKIGTAEDIRKEEAFRHGQSSDSDTSHPLTALNPARGEETDRLSQRVLRVVRSGLASRCDRPFQAMLTRWAATVSRRGLRTSSHQRPVSATMPTSACE